MKYRINLLPERKQTVLDRIIFFSFNYLRYILVVTQLVVICVFMYRFNIDQEIVDAKDTLHQKQEIVRVSQPLLKEGDTMYKRVQNISTLVKSQDTTSQMLSYILGRFPEQFFLTDLEVKGDSLKLEGSTGDANVIKIYFSRLKKENRFKEINLTNISKTTDGYFFTFLLNKFF